MNVDINYNGFTSLIQSLQSKSKKTNEDLENFDSIDQEIERLLDLLEEINLQIANFYVYDTDQDKVAKNLKVLNKKLEDVVDSAKEFCGDTRTRYQAEQQLVPSDLNQALTNLELRAEETIHAMDEKQREQKRAKTTRSEYLSDVDEVQNWVRNAELKIQDRSVEPAVLMEHLRQIQNELTPISDKLERLTKNAREISENVLDEHEKDLIASTVANLTEQFGQVKSWLDERKQVVGDTMDAWSRFLSLYEAVKAWTEEKKAFLAEPLKLSTLSQARQKLHDYSTAVKNCKQVNKNLSDMGKELEIIGQTTSVGNLPEKLAEAEEHKVEVEGQLLQRNALLQETSEEWEQCEKKMKDVRNWMEKARQSLESPQNKKKPIRDQHAIREKMLSDIEIQKTKISLSVEKLQVHFRSGIGGDSRVSETADKIIAELEELHKVVKEQTTSLEACLTQLDQYQQEIQELRQQIIQVEQQLRTVMSPTYLPDDRDKAQQEQQDLQTKMGDWNQRIGVLVEQINAVDPNYVQPDASAKTSYADIAAGKKGSRDNSPCRSWYEETAISPSSTCQLSQPTNVLASGTKDQEGTSEVRARSQVKREDNKKQAKKNNKSEKDGRRGRSLTRKPEIKPKDVKIEVSTVPVDDNDFGLTITKQPIKELEINRSKLAPQVDKRTRSPSPIWVPGSTSYADILRGRMHSGSRASSEAPSEGEDNQSMVSLTGKVAMKPKEISIQHGLVNNNSNQMTHNEAKEENISEQESIQSQNKNWSTDSVPYNAPVDTANYANIANPNQYNYINQMPELVGYITSQLTNYPATSYVYSPGAHQQMEAISLQDYNTHYGQSTFLPTNTATIYQQEQQNLVQHIPSSSNAILHQPQIFNENIASNVNFNPEMMENLTDRNSQRQTREFENMNIEVSRKPVQVEKKSESTVTVNLEAKDPLFSYAQILTQGLSSKPLTEEEGNFTPEKINEKNKSEESVTSINIADINMAQSEKTNIEIVQDNSVASKKETKSDIPKKIESKSKVNEQKKNESDQKKKETDKKKKESEQKKMVKSEKDNNKIENIATSSQKSLLESEKALTETPMKNNDTKVHSKKELQVEDSKKDNDSAEKKKKQKKKNANSSKGDEIDRALKEIEDMIKQQKAKAKDKVQKDQNKSKLDSNKTENDKLVTKSNSNVPKKKEFSEPEMSKSHNKTLKDTKTNEENKEKKETKVEQKKSDNIDKQNTETNKSQNDQPITVKLDDTSDKQVLDNKTNKKSKKKKNTDKVPKSEDLKVQESKKDKDENLEQIKKIDDSQLEKKISGDSLKSLDKTQQTKGKECSTSFNVKEDTKKTEDKTDTSTPKKENVDKIPASNIPSKKSHNKKQKVTASEIQKTEEEKSSSQKMKVTSKEQDTDSLIKGINETDAKSEIFVKDKSKSVELSKNDVSISSENSSTTSLEVTKKNDQISKKQQKESKELEKPVSITEISPDQSKTENKPLLSSPNQQIIKKDKKKEEKEEERELERDSTL